LEAHKVVEPIQTLDALPYFISRMLRGAYVFEQISYLELRYNPYFRLPKDLPEKQIEQKLEEIVATIATAAKACHREFPIQFTQILCLDTRLPKRINQLILETALRMPNDVAALDIAGPAEEFWGQEDDLLALLRKGKDAGLKITVHAYETESGCFRSVLEYADRIGHGIQIPLREPALLNQLARRGVCLEICPTSYFRTGTLRTYNELKPIFSACFDLGVDVAICTDNSALHGVRLPLEFERLLIHGVLSFPQIERIRENAFRHAFRYQKS
jgi:adenosine deaminase